MPMKIAILEDNEDRRSAMRACLADRFYQYEARFFDDPKDMVSFLDRHLNDTILISLDHDIELKPHPSGRALDPGTGQEVADFLAGRPPVCPVILATTNSAAADRMEAALKETDWRTRRVIPFDDVNWVPGDWLRAVRRAILSTARPATEGKAAGESPL